MEDGFIETKLFIIYFDFSFVWSDFIGWKGPDGDYMEVQLKSHKAQLRCLLSQFCLLKYLIDFNSSFLKDSSESTSS